MQKRTRSSWRNFRDCMNFKTSSFLLILIAPSGGGKSTIGDLLLEREGNLEYSISSTTRHPRKDERDGSDYFFLEESNFLSRKEAGEFLETALVHNYWYGTSKVFIESKLKEGRNILLDIDVQGALKILEKGIECVTVFILPPHQDVLEKRLRARQSDSDETISLRLKNAAEEISQIEKFDYLVINDDLEKAVKDVQQIIRVEEMRSKRYLNIEEEYYRSEDA